MAHPSEVVIRQTYDALNRGDIAGFVSMWTPDAVLHGGSGVTVAGAEEIGRLLRELREATGGTLRWELHDVLANDEHAVALHVTRAELGGRALEDRVAYVFHLRGYLIAEAWFNGDPRVQADFYGSQQIADLGESFRAADWASRGVGASPLGRSSIVIGRRVTGQVEPQSGSDGAERT